ncbi:hypothetical protein [Sphingopyxis flava]|uniref:Uncharacterized protein n=1 Tax=Sphingopyxis flava TaxID=1507287 RepID=A0A1T5CT57_9SPHN|nr:hypothetical protein [Sphingopyxis flava]SKB62649.1 hypothetical protein SAMN06295937_101193 [Sphingopyxis flava]
MRLEIIIEPDDRPVLRLLLKKLQPGDQLILKTLPGHGVVKPRNRLSRALQRSHQKFNVTVDREIGRIICERTS